MFRLRRTHVALAAASLIAAVVVVLVSATAQVHVSEPPPPSGYLLSVGWPFDWVEQRSSVTPPLPYDVGLGSPTDNPTDVNGWWLGLDVVLVGAAILLVAETVRGALAGRGSGSSAAAGR